jgi:hypothetical protein
MSSGGLVHGLGDIWLAISQSKIDWPPVYLQQHPQHPQQEPAGTSEASAISANESRKFLIADKILEDCTFLPILSRVGLDDGSVGID